VTYFFDNNFAPRLVGMLTALSVDARHLRDEFPTNTQDVEWIPAVAQRGWVIVTIDRKILKRPAEREALQRCGADAVFLPGTPFQKDMWAQAEWLTKHWRAIDDHLRTARHPVCCRITDRGKIEDIPAI
jgi:hypothetical protein